jgi:hypothetical protein
MENNKVVKNDQWQIDEILSRAGVGKVIRENIRGLSLRDQTSFIAWILFALSIPTIQYPVLFAYKRNQESAAPEGFNQLAQMPVEEFYKWLVVRGEDIPERIVKTIQELRKQRAHEKLLSMGAIHPSLDEFVVNNADSDAPPGADIKRYTPPIIIRTDGMTAEKAWSIAKGQLQAEIDKAVFDTWIKDVEYLDFKEGVIKLGVVNDFARQWLEDRLTSITERVLSGIFGEHVTVQFVMMYEDI